LIHAVYKDHQDLVVKYRNLKSQEASLVIH
jgi:hypothetical protein